MKIKPYKYPHCHKIEIEQMVAQMLIEGLIEPSSSPFSSPVLLVRKKMDYGDSIHIIELLMLSQSRIHFPIPTVDTLLDKL